jgi:hypothetical protein
MEFSTAARVLYTATTDLERRAAAATVAALSPRTLAWAEQHPQDPAALDALAQVIVQELWLENNTDHPGRGEKVSLQARAVDQLLRDHLNSERLVDPCRRVSYGFSADCERLLRAALEKSPHRDVRGLACMRLAQFLNGRLRRLQLCAVRPEMARRYEGLFGKGYFQAQRRKDPAQVTREVEAFYERARNEYGDVKVPYEGTVAEKAASELHEIRVLAVGKPAPELEGEDQDGKRFKLSDYRGKVVLLYFWSEY